MKKNIKSYLSKRIKVYVLCIYIMLHLLERLTLHLLERPSPFIGAPFSIYWSTKLIPAPFIGAPHYLKQKLW